MSLYVETSALLSYLYEESKYDEAVQKMENADTVVTSRLTLIESERCIVRNQAVGKVSELKSRRQLMELHTLTVSWTIIEITPSVCKRAGEKFPIEPVRSLDAIHLSSMLEAIDLYPDLKILSFDERILENVKMLGLSEA